MFKVQYAIAVLGTWDHNAQWHFGGPVTATPAPVCVGLTRPCGCLYSVASAFETSPGIMLPAESLHEGHATSGAIGFRSKGLLVLNTLSSTQRAPSLLPFKAYQQDLRAGRIRSCKTKGCCSCWVKPLTKNKKNPCSEHAPG